MASYISLSLELVHLVSISWNNFILYRCPLRLKYHRLGNLLNNRTACLLLTVVEAGESKFKATMLVSWWGCLPVHSQSFLALSSLGGWDRDPSRASFNKTLIPFVSALPSWPDTSQRPYFKSLGLGISTHESGVRVGGGTQTDIAVHFVL